MVYLDQEGGAYARTTVKPGRRGDSLVEILSGLKAGDKVVTNGNLLIDGQAEMNRAFMSPADIPVPVSMANALTAPQKQAIGDFVKVADTMAAGLAADDLAAFNRSAQPAMTATSGLSSALAGLPGMDAKLPALAPTAHFHGTGELKAARAAFLKFTLAATDVLAPLRKLDGFPDMQIWECPMVNQSVPGSAAKGRWIQTGGRPIQNPFFGAEMLDCGTEIKP